MTTNRLIALHEAGQSVWLDFIDRSILRNGDLARMIREDALSGMTSNPTIFEKALAEGDEYDDQIKSAPPVEVTTADPNALPVVVDGTAKKNEKTALKTEAVADKKPADAKTAQAEQPVQPPVVATDSQLKEKPFWKIW